MRYFNQIFQGFLLFLQLDLSRMNLNIITTVSGIDFIKFVTNYGFDGFLFNEVNISSSVFFSKFVKCISQLPTPYNFNWDFFLDLSKTS